MLIFARFVDFVVFFFVSIQPLPSIQLQRLNYLTHGTILEMKPYFIIVTALRIFYLVLALRSMEAIFVTQKLKYTFRCLWRGECIVNSLV